jgi:radical SAM enzyme (TIGR01210 family)
MNEIASFCSSFKKDVTPKGQNPREPVRCWSEKDVLNGKITDAYVLILRTRGCSWALSSGCTMCGYFNDSMSVPVSDSDLTMQFENAMERYNGEPIIKIFTSGSFLDPHEIPVPVRTHILKTLSQQAEKISVESRPEYITTTVLSEIQPLVRQKAFEVGIGLETSNDLLRTKAINKGFAFSAYKTAAKQLKQQHFGVKTYVLLKPPFITEKEALDDCIKTAKDVKSFATMLSLNPTNVQRHTVVEYLWKRDQYRPAWLWSVVEFLKQSKKITDMPVKCDVVGGGSIRGAHNCGTCDHSVLDAIAQFSLSQKTSVFNNLTCSCQEQWRDQLASETLSFGSLVDYGRWES